MGIDNPYQIQGGETSNVVATGSPFVIQNNQILSNQAIVINGGTVTIIEISRNGSDYFTVGLISGQFILSPGDYLRITYAIAPTITRFL